MKVHNKITAPQPIAPNVFVRSARYSGSPPIAGREGRASANLRRLVRHLAPRPTLKALCVLTTNATLRRTPGSRRADKKLFESRIFHSFALDGAPTHIMQLTAD